MTHSLAAFALSLAFSAAGAPQDDVPPDGDRLVRVAVIANREVIRPGEKFILGVELEVEPRWHVYWTNPGDSGLPTKIQIKAPDGFEVGNVISPGPVRHTLEGDITTYVHAGRFMYLCELKAPATLDSGKPWKFTADASWLVCDELCVPGKGQAEIVLSSIGASDAARPAHDKEFAAARKMIPKPWTELAGATLAWSGTTERPTLRVNVPDAAKGVKEIDYFPTRSASTELVGQRASSPADARALDLEFAFESQAASDRPATRGLVMVKTADGVSYYALNTAFGDGKAPASR